MSTQQGSTMPTQAPTRETCWHYLNYCCERPLGRCRFPHRHAQRAPAPYYKGVCRHWSNNTCAYGVNECNFHHPYEKGADGLPVGARWEHGMVFFPGSSPSGNSPPERWSQQCPLMDKCPNRGNGCPHRHVVIAHGTRPPQAAHDRPVGESSQTAQDDADDGDDDGQYARPPTRERRWSF
ncbi:hypothetical protein CcaCcLH18_01923 [Colletotrichum camelliae]|nr:hypothetical protein CcaCcLH18_01923 [Colletotrichum camelliae]